MPELHVVQIQNGEHFQLGQADGPSPFLESNLSKYNSPNKL